MDSLFIGGTFGAKKKPTFSSGSTWRDRTDLERLPPRKMPTAGIVKMYLSNNELVGTVENPLYSSLSDGRGHSDSLMDNDTLIVQPLLKKKLCKQELPALAVDNSNSKVTATLTTITQSSMSSEQFDVLLGNSMSHKLGQDHVVESRVS